jgi:hypothetical protein
MRIANGFLLLLTFFFGGGGMGGGGLDCCICCILRDVKDVVWQLASISESCHGNSECYQPDKYGIRYAQYLYFT